MEFISLPKYIITLITSLLDVHSHVKLGQANKYLREICADQQLWKDFCVVKCDPHISLLFDINNPDYKVIYISLFKLTDNEVLSYLQAKWLQKRLNSTIRDPLFLQCFVHLYAGRGTPNELKQIMSLDYKNSSIGSGIFKMIFKLCPNQQKTPLFFYGERGIFTTVDLVAVGRTLEPREIKVVNNAPFFGRTPKGSWYHFQAFDHVKKASVLARISPLTSNQLNDIGLTSRYVTNSTSSHLKQRRNEDGMIGDGPPITGGVPNYSIGELEALCLEIPISELFSGINPTYSTLVAQSDV